MDICFAVCGAINEAAPCWEGDGRPGEGSKDCEEMHGGEIMGCITDKRRRLKDWISSWMRIVVGAPGADVVKERNNF